MRLPLEIVDVVLSILSEDDSGLLPMKACSLVCHDFLDLARSHIFASVAIDDAYDRFSAANSWKIKTTTYKFCDFFCANPEMAKYIRSLVYVMGQTLMGREGYRLLTDAFNRMTNVRSLTIWHVRPQYDSPDFHWNDHPLRPVFLDLLRCPTLVHFAISTVKDFDLVDLMACVNLRTFEFNHVGTNGCGDLTSLSGKPLQLRKIKVGYNSTDLVRQLCTSKVQNGKAIIDFDSLSSISTDMESLVSVGPSSNLLRQCKHLLEVDIQAVSAPNPSFAGLSSMLKPSLYCLKRLRAEALYGQWQGNDPFCGLVPELDEIRNHNTLQKLILAITINTDSDCPRGDEWGLLDKTLSQPGWPELELVSLTITIASYVRGDDGLEKALRQLPEKQFPYLTSEKKSFKFDFIVESVLV